MSQIARSLGVAAILPLLAASSAASAAVLDVTAVGVQSYNTLSVNGQNDIASAIDLTVRGDPKPVWVWCVDISHSVTIGSYNPALMYQTSPVLTDSTGPQSGTGNPLSPMVSGEIQTLADIGNGLLRAATPDSEKITAIQGAIWTIEYPTDSVVGTTLENTDIAKYITYAKAHPAVGYAPGLYPTGPSGQGFGYTQGFATGVPEPAAWAMLILGFAHLGASLRCRAAALRLSRKRA
jgi:hypothetical protein